MTETIPEDIKQAATRIADRYLSFDISCQRLYADVAQAILAERERAANIADDHDVGAPHIEYSRAAIAIAQAIRGEGNGKAE